METGELLNHAWKAAHEPADKLWRSLLRQAVPFTLDESSIRIVTQLAQRQERVAQYGRLARLPFPVIWMEYKNSVRHTARDEFFKIKTEIAEGSSEIVGWLIEGIGPTRWRLTVVGAGGQGNITSPLFFPIQFIFDPNGTDDYSSQITDGSLRMAIYALSNKLRNKAWGYSVRDLPGTEIENSLRAALDSFVAPSGLKDNCVFLDLEPNAAELLLKTHLRPHERREKLAELFEIEVKENMGELRYVCAALATINDVPLIRHEIKPAKLSFRSSGGIREYRVNQLVTIMLPKSRVEPIKQILKIFGDTERRMRRHSVRGHFKRYKTSDGTIQRKWIESYDRGDASLGWVQRSYNVTA